MRSSAGDVLTVTIMQRFVTKLSKDDAEAAAETQLKQPPGHTTTRQPACLLVRS